MTTFPITLNSLVNLADPQYEIPEKFFRSGSTTVEGDKSVCVCFKKGDTSQVVVVDLQKGTHSTRNMTDQADAAIMHPTDPVISVRGKTSNGHFIQVFNLNTKDRLGEHQFEEDVVFWKWANEKILAVVTRSAVYHWSLEVGTQQDPQKLFTRSGKLASTSVQIINYRVDSQVKWCLLTGISTADGRTIDGCMQLYSVEKEKEQLLDGHAGCFSELVVDEAKGPTGVFAFAEKAPGGKGGSRLHVRDIYANRGEGFKILVDINYPPDATSDFPVSMHLSLTFGVLYIVTKGGCLLLFDALTGTALYTHKISNDTVFLSAYNSHNGGIIAVNKKGLVLTATINEFTILPYIQNNLRHLPNYNEMSLSLARRYGLPGADDQLTQQFNSFFAQGNFKSAARIVAIMKSGALRTPQTVEQFKAVPKSGDQLSAILQYFSTLLEHGKLTAFESVELCQPVVQQGRREFIEKWLQEDKLEYTEQLGDVLKPLDTKLALTVYLKAEVSPKVVHCFVELGEYDKIIAYTKNTGFQADFSFILRNMAAVNPEAASGFAKQLLESEPPMLDVNVIVDIFSQQNAFQEITNILLEFLKANKSEHGYLQTRLLEVNLIHAPQVAEAIFQMDLFSHYDRKKVATLCEKAGLYQRALEHFTEGPDVRRIIARTGGQLNADWLSSYLGKLSPEAAVECLTDMLRANRQNLQMAVQMGIKYHERIGAKTLVAMFESFESWDGVFCFLGSILAFNSDPEVHFKYIEAAAKLNHMTEVERVCRESQVYDAQKVKEFLKKEKLADPRPLIYVCDMHGFEAELAEYLYHNSLMKFIEVYVTRVNPQKAPVVIGQLIDLDCSEDFIKSLLQTVRGAAPTGALVETFERRNRLRLLLPWLESRLSEGNNEPEMHNALAKIYIDTNREPENFLKSNQFYDSKVVGQYCEVRDPHLAFTAYKRAWGSCDTELVAVTNKNGLFRLQARYLVERQSPELWSIVLDPDSEFRQQVIDQIVSTALPESSDPEEVSVTVKAFVHANLPQDLIELLEKIVLHNSDFSSNKNLQNLLLLTAMKADPSRVMDYVNRLDFYEGKEIAEIALKDDYKLYEEALQIYKKSNLDAEAIGVLLAHIKSLDRAREFAARRNVPAVWSKLAKAQLASNLLVEAIESYLKAEDAEDYPKVIEAARNAAQFDLLIDYLFMARKKAIVKDASIDSELVYCLAKRDRLQEMQDFVSGTNTANMQVVGERLFDDRSYKAAKLLFSSIPNHSKLASCHLQLKEFSQAIEAAKKANSPKTWKEVNLVCVSARQSQCAHTAGLHIIVHPDHLDELITHYERSGLSEELISLLEAGVNGERSHVGLFTELGVLYAKYKPSKLAEYFRSVNVSSNRLNIPRLIRACERHQLWSDAIYMHITYSEFDQAANVMILHSATTWKHDEFCNLMQKVSNVELFYRAINFYVEEHPMDINSLLIAIAQKIDHARVVQQFRKHNRLALILPYLQAVQTHNIATVNDAVNELLLECYDTSALRTSISEYDNFDQIGLASRLETHELLEMRRLAALLYKKNKKFKQAIEISKKDVHYQDAMETARASMDATLVETLLRFFTSTKNRACFAACLVTCYDLIPPHTAMELAWRCGFIDQVMPYMMQVMKEYTVRLDSLEKKLGNQEEAAKREKSAPNDFVPNFMIPQGGMGGPILPGMNNLALMNDPTTSTFGVTPHRI